MSSRNKTSSNHLHHHKEGKNSQSNRRRSSWRLSTLSTTVMFGTPPQHPTTPTRSSGGSMIRPITMITPNTTTKDDRYEKIQKEYETRIQEQITNLSNDMIVRFFRRSFFQALGQNDLSTAYYCYIATRDDFEHHCMEIVQQTFVRLISQQKEEDEEEEERQRQAAATNAAATTKNRPNTTTLRSHFKRNGVVVDSPSSVILAPPNLSLVAALDDGEDGEDSSIPTTPIVAAEASETQHRTIGLLQQTMDICEPFQTDDYYDPYHDLYHDPYHEPYRRPIDGAMDDIATSIIADTEDGILHMDAMNTLFQEISRLSTGNIIRDVMKQKPPTQLLPSPSTTPTSSSFILTRSRSAHHQRQRRINDTDTNYGSEDAIVGDMAGEIPPQPKDDDTVINPMILTTPLHEVARLGHVELLKCMLQQQQRSHRRKQIDFDVRNGYGRTVLHNVAGGLAGIDETNHSNARIATSMDVDTGNLVRYGGIDAPPNPKRHIPGNDIAEESMLSTDGEHDGYVSNTNEGSVTRRISRMMHRSGRWLSLRNIKSKMNDDVSTTFSTTKATQQVNQKGRYSLPSFGKLSSQSHKVNIPMAQVDRVGTMNIILSWRNDLTTTTCTLHDSDDEEVHTENEIDAIEDDAISFTPYKMGVGSDFGFGDHVSINAVDLVMNRTALHYAAELGRVDICEAILSSFYGTMLTILDNTGRTPCELAAQLNHNELASYLEARSLLYVDPYGTEEELLSTISIAEMNHNDVAYYRHNLVAPYCCFETISRETVKHRREKLIQEAIEQIDLHVAEFYQQRQQRRIEALNAPVKVTIDPPGRTVITGNEDDTTESTDAADDTDFVVEQRAMTLEKRSPAILDKEREFFDAASDVDNPRSTIEDCQLNNDDEIYSTAKEIGIHEGHVEKLLSYHKWLVSDVIAALRQNPKIAFHNANVPVPPPPAVSLNKSNTDELPQKHTCLICCDEFETNSDTWKQMSGCGHGFCESCLIDYITEYTTSSTTGYVIECPHHDCSALISSTVINDVIQPNTDTYDRLQRSAIDAFVVSAQDYTYCPYPGCGETKVIRTLYPMSVNPSDLGILRLIGGVCTNVNNLPSDSKSGKMKSLDDEPEVLTYESVPDPQHYNLLDMIQPQLAHRFCFLCGEKRIHWPITCSQLKDWRSTIIEQVGERNASNESGSSSNYNDIAQNLWMKVNTRPCPKCNAPIQKDEGCNHITCRNPHCKHQFCWICRANWSTHNTSTGGNYRCNRWVDQPEHDIYDGETTIDDETRARVLAEEETDPSLMNETYGTARHESRVSRKRSSETARFLHHYERWCGHADSAVLEHKMRMSLCERMAPVVAKAIEYGGGTNIFGGKGISFLHAAFSELLECRSMLQHSYVYAFINYKLNTLSRQQSNEKVIFERIQSELELLTEQISGVVARNHIRASETQILFLTKVVSGKRKEFTNYMIELLRLAEIDKNKPLHPNQVNLPGHRPTPVRSGDDIGDDDEAAEAIRASLDTYEAANRQLRGNMYDDDNELHDWACTGCTYMNAGTVRRCDMCDTRRGVRADAVFINGE